MPLANPKFQIHASQDLKRDSARLKELTELKRVERLKHDDKSGLFADPQDPAFAPVDDDTYGDMMERYHEAYDDNEYQALVISVPQAKAQHQAAYDQLKQQLQQDVHDSGEQHPGQKIDFDDNELRVDIDYGYMECMDRFSKVAKNQIKTLLGHDPSQAKPYFQDIFRDELGSEDVKKSFEEKYTEVLDDYRKQGTKAFTDPSGVPDLTGAKDGKDCVDKVFDSQPGMCLNDNHGETGGKDFLTDNMASMKQKGVDTLFIEHFWEEHQPLLDEYMTGGDNDPLPKPLEEFINRVLEKEPTMKGKFTGMLAEAKKQKMRLVGLDSFDAKTREDGDPRKWDQRAAKFNAKAAEIVNREKGAGKFLLLAGDDHNNTHFSGFPGLAQILGVQTFAPNGGKLLPKQDENKENRGVRSEAQQAYYDAFIEEFRQQSPNSNPEAIMKAATALARKQGKGLDRLKPSAAIRLAKQAANGTIAQLNLKGTQINTGGDVGAILQQAEAESDEFKGDVQQLRDAVKDNKPKKIKKILKKYKGDPRILMVGMDGDASLLHAIAKGGDKDLTALLMKRGLNPNCQDDKGDTPLNAVLTLGANSQDQAHSEVMQELLKGRARLDVPNQQGQTPVHRAVELKSEALLKEFAGKRGFKAANEMPDANGKMPIQLAIDGGNPKEFRKLDALLRKKGLDPKTFRIPPKNETLLHYAAGKNDPKMVKRLLDSGFAATDTDADGNTPLHKLVNGDNKDIDAASSLLLQNGASLATPNNAGETPLHKALDVNFDTTPPYDKWMANHKADFTNAATVKKGKLSVLDLAIARGYVALEDAMYDNGIVADTPPVALGPTEQKTTPEILALATVYDSDEARQKGPDLYKKLYEDYPEFRSTMDLAALKTMGDRRNNKALRLFMINADSPGKVTLGGGSGAYDNKNESLALGIDRPQETLMGTMIHEMTHHAASKLYGNDAQPFRPTDTAIQKDYHKAIREMGTQSNMAFGPDERSLQWTMNGRLLDYSRKPKGTVMVNQEVIVGVPQILVEQGRDMLERRGGPLLEFWDKTFRVAIDNAVTTDPKSAKLKPTTSTGKEYKPDNPWIDKSGLGQLSEDKIDELFDRDTVMSDSDKLTSAMLARKAFREARVQQGNCLDTSGDTGMPLFDVGFYQYPDEIQIQFVANAGGMNANQLRLEAQKILNTAKNYSQDGWYQEVAKKAQDIVNQPPTTSQEDMLQMIKDLNTQVNDAYKKYAPLRKAMKDAEVETAKTLEKILRSKNLPANLSTEVIAGLVHNSSGEVDKLVRKVDQMIIDGKSPDEITQALPGLMKKFDGSLKKLGPKFISAAKKAEQLKPVLEDRARKKALYRHKIVNGLDMTDEEFAEAIVLQAEEDKQARNPPPDGYPLTVNPEKHARLIQKVAARIKGKEKDAQLFEKATRVVRKKGLNKKNKSGAEKKAHVSIPEGKKKEQWLLDLASIN